MINATDGQLVINETGAVLDAAIVEGLWEASQALLRAYNLELLDLQRVTTKNGVRVSFSKFIELVTLERRDIIFGESYLQNTFKICMGRSEDITIEQFYALTLAVPGGEFDYKTSYARRMPLGAAMFLLTLHSFGTVTLPFSFRWPSIYNEHGRRMEIGMSVCSELLAFIRTLDSQGDHLPDPAFLAINNDRKGREYFLTYGTKLLLATGWHRPSDANLEDLLALKESENQGLLRPASPPPFRLLLDILTRRFGTAIAVSPADWSTSIILALNNKRTVTSVVPLKKPLKEAVKARFLLRNDADILEEVILRKPGFAAPARLKRVKALPGLNIGCDGLISRWLQLEELFLRKTKAESVKGLITGLCYLNLYLFYYLPYWFDRNPDVSFTFPDCPAKLTASIFISRLLDVGGPTPLTFMEFMDCIHVNRGWVNNGYYALLLAIEKFFTFIEKYSDEFSDCKGFRQPMSREDYPRTSRGGTTSKPPIPQRIFTVLIAYVEAMRSHHECILRAILAGGIDGSLLAGYLRYRRIIDTVELAEIFGGVVPVIFVNGKTIPLRYIPNFLMLKRFSVKAGEESRLVILPQPHALNQILCALYTGLRHNHIQWLDATKFDSLVTNLSGDFAQLHVNTDKRKTGAWAPHVNMRVIDVLRDQKEWRQLIAGKEFAQRHYYNNNPETKWPKILPLFSAFSDGRPHHDSQYERAWRYILGGLQAILPDLAEPATFKVCQLVPPGTIFNDPNVDEKRRLYGKECDEAKANVCKLRLVSDIVPHSCRVSVVSQYTPFLPAAFIGKYITGQTEPVVHYYAKVEPEYLELEATHQAMRLRCLAVQGSLDALTGKDEKASAHWIQADRVNSRFAQSLRTDVNETLISFGCVSLTLNEDDTSGLDVLRETRGLNAAENKTEICPYGNHCPPEIIKQWRGPRRCGLCQYAVRSVDHLQAVTAKTHAMEEELDALTNKVTAAMEMKPAQYSHAELDRLDEERTRLGEELAGWKVVEEVLEAARQRIITGMDSNGWFVQEPEIVAQDLRRVALPSNLTSYVLLRLQECTAYPSLENPEMRARFDVLRRTLLVRAGKLREAFSQTTPISPAAECVGLLRTMADANSFTAQDLIDMLEGGQSAAAVATQVEHRRISSD